MQAIFTSIITALQQILMLYDGCVGPETGAGGCGSWWATGIMASVNLQHRTFCLRGLFASWHGWIDNMCSTTLSPAASSLNLPPTAHCILTLQLWFFLMWLLISWVLNNQRGVRKKMIEARPHFFPPLPELTEELKIVTFILVRDWFQAMYRNSSSVFPLLSRGAGVLSDHVAGV